MKQSLIDPALYPPLYKEITLDQGEIQSLNATPVQLLPSPGPNRTIRLEKLIITTKNAGTAFAGADTAVSINFTDASGPEFAATVTGFLAETLTHITPVLPTVYSGTPALVANQALVVTAANDFTLGEAASELVVQLWYVLVPLA